MIVTERKMRIGLLLAASVFVFPLWAKETSTQEASKNDSAGTGVSAGPGLSERRESPSDQPETYSWTRPKTDEESIQGVWTAVSAEIAGQAAPSSAIKNFTVVITADKFVFNPKTDNRTSSYKLDAKKSPKVIELTPLNGPIKGQAQKAIYELKDGKLKLCAENGKKDPPKEFATKEKTNLRLLILKRAKK